MFSHSNQIAIPFSFETELRAWVNAVYENAVGKGFVRVPWHPAEAVRACFCPSH
jgi:hypothetical protein